MNAEHKRELVDTNILVYAHDISAGEKHTLARDLLQNLWQTGNGCLSVQILHEFYVTITRKVTQPLSLDDASEIIRDLSFWQIFTPGAEDVLGAIDIQKHYQISFWDAMIVQSAIDLGCSLIWSEDLSDGQTFEGVLVRNPFLTQR
jgi:predicted nucleic acid-binding protein